MAANPESVRFLRAEVLRWLHEHHLRDEKLSAAIALATSEAVANVVRHAYGSGPGRVDLDATIGDEDILIQVVDRGPGLTARAADRTGFGLPVIGRVSNGVTVASDSEGTTVSMRFTLSTTRNHPRRERFARAAHAFAGRS